MRNKTVTALAEMGLSMSLIGFTYICDAIELISENQEYLTDTCKLYQEIADKRGRTSNGVEGSIRYAFGLLVTSGILERVTFYLGVEKKSNSECLASLYGKLLIGK